MFCGSQTFLRAFISHANSLPPDAIETPLAAVVAQADPFATRPVGFPD
jgi:hypothetical protein